jgi:hypothetical protein
MILFTAKTALRWSFGRELFMNHDQAATKSVSQVRVAGEAGTALGSAGSGFGTSLRRSLARGWEKLVDQS